MPETIIFYPLIAKSFLKMKGKFVLKRRFGRGGRGFKINSDLEYLSKLNIKNDLYLLQEYINILNQKSENIHYP